MAPPTPPTAITLKVKVPPGYLDGGFDEFPLGSFPVSTTIGALRQQIQTLVPTHPLPERQRLLYGGRALIDNEQTIADALNTKRDASQTEYVIHLLVKGEGMSGGGPAGHARSASTPVVPPPQQAPVPNQRPPPQLAAHHQAHNLAHQQAVARQLQMQQLLQGQANGNNMTPFQQQLMQTNPQFPMQQGLGFGGAPLPHAPAAFQQRVAEGQQQRAAAGMQGVGSGQQTQLPAQGGDGPADSTPRAQSIPLANGSTTQQQATPATAQQHPQSGHHIPHRPISGQGFHLEGVGPNGQRFQIHQQTLNIPFGGQMPPYPLPAMPQLNLPTMPPGFMAPIPGMQAAPTGPSALDRARDNMAEMRRMLDEMRNSSGTTTEEQRTRISNLTARVESVNNYIDPLNLHNTTPTLNTNNTSSTTRSTSPNTSGLAASPQRAAQTGLYSGAFPPMWHHGQARTTSPLGSVAPQLQPSSNPEDVTCYLLSSPQGPQALLFTPQHGTYTGTLARQQSLPQPTPTTQAHQAPLPYQAQNVQNAQNAIQAGQVVANDAPPAAAQPDPLGPFAPLINHLWLLLRLLIFAYFLLGANMGWKRPLALLVIGMGFWMVRMGLFGEGGVARRWWEGIVRVPGVEREGGRGAGNVGLGGGGQAAAGRDQARQRENEAASAGGGAAQQGDHGNANNNASANNPVSNGSGAAGNHGARTPMPTPEQVAQRLLNERQQHQNARLRQVREMVRPVERAVALFVASLWPGIGEAHVRERREVEERRRAEEEVERVRREEEGRKRVEEGREGQGKEGEGSGAKECEGEGSKADEAGVGSAGLAEKVEEKGEGEGSVTA